MTLALQLLLRHILTEPGREWYGREVVGATGLPEGTVYPMLARLERAGWLAVRHESRAERAAQQRPARRYLTLTEFGVARARAALASLPTHRVQVAALSWPEPQAALEAVS